MADGYRASVPAQRFLIWISIVFAMLFGVAVVPLMRFFPPPTPMLPAHDVALLYSEHNVRFRVGTIIGVISGGFMAPFAIATSIAMARLEKGLPVWAILQGIMGALGTITVWMPMVIWAAAAFSADRAPELTLLLHELGWLMFVTPLALFPLQLIGIVIVAFTKEEDDRVSAFPRWMGYLTAWQLIQAFGAPLAILFKQGIFSWAGLLAFWIPTILFFVWMMLLCWTMLRALRHQEEASR